MADIEERLRILVEAQNRTKGELAKATQELDKANTRIKKMDSNLAQTNKRAKVLSDIFGEFATKVPLFLAADVLARVVGFTSLMDALNKTLDGVAGGIRGLAVQGFNNLFSTDQAERAKQLATAIKSLATESKRLGDEIRAQSRSGIVDFEGFAAGLDVRGFQGDLESQKKAVDEIERFSREAAERLATARQQFNLALFQAVTAEQRASLTESFEQTLQAIEEESKFSVLMRRLGEGFAGEFSVGFNQSLQALVFTKTPEAIEKAFESVKARLLTLSSEGIGFGTIDTSPRQTADGIAAQNAETVRLVQQNLTLRSLQAELLTGTEKQIEAQRILTATRELQAKVAFAQGQIDEDTTKAILRAIEEIDRRARESILFQPPAAVQSRLGFFEAIKAGAQEAANSIGDIEDQGRAVGAAFVDSFAFGLERTFDSIQNGSIRAKQFFGEFAKSVISDIARILQRLAALRLASAIFGGLAPGVAGVSGAGVVTNPGTSAGIGAPGGGPAPLGGLISPSTNAGGGNVAYITINVGAGGEQSAKTLIDSIPTIARHLAEAISSGSSGSRDLRIAIGEV